MVSELRRAREREHYLASHDSLTGLLNRSSFNENLRRAVAQAKRQDRLMAVLFLDLDNFKTINDTLGHPVGDQLLVQLAERLKHVTRESDILARIGGDEFIVGITSISKEYHAGTVANEILSALKNPFMLEGCEYRLTTSIGVTVYPQDGTDTDVLIRNADTAMYYAKNQGRDRYQFYTEEMNARAVTRLDLENRLRQVVARDELVLHYQPMVDVAAGGIIAAEALVRWQHPVRGLLSSDEFIPVAEEIGVIGILGEWVLRKACQDAVEWPQVRGEPIRLTVNVSCRQLGRADFADRVMEILEETGFPANRLDLEITESSLMKDQGIAMETLTVLRNRGVRIALDDFGIEYSSLRALKTMPINTLKIDRCFVAGVVSDPRDATIVTDTITMARGLGLELVAEGVETAEQVEFLYGLGCFRMQGCLFAKPAPLAEVVRHFTDPCADWQQTLESLGV